MIAGSACDNLRKDDREMDVYLDRVLAAYSRSAQNWEVIFYASLRSDSPI
jgi:hypothetical protein